MKNKKILLGSMSAVLAIATPIATVVSCNKTKTLVSASINIQESIEYAKNKATKWNNDNGKWGQNGRSPMGYSLGSIAKQIFNQLGKQVPAFKILEDKLNKAIISNNAANNQKGEQTFFDAIGEKLVDEILNNNTINDGSGKEKSLNEFLGGLKANFTNTEFSSILELWKVVESGKNPFKVKIDPDTQKPKQDIQKIKNGTENLDITNKWEVIQDSANYQNFNSKILQEKFEEGIKAMIIALSLMPISTILEIMPTPTVENVVKGIFATITPLIEKSKIDYKDIQKLAKDIQGKKIKISINIFGMQKSFTSKVIKLPNKINETLQSAKPDIATILSTIRDEILAPVKKWDKNQKLSDLINKKQVSNDKIATPKVQQTTKENSADPIQNIMETIKKYLTSEVISSIVDALELINNVATNSKITKKTPFAFENQITVQKLIKIVSSISPSYGEIVGSVMKTLSGIARIYIDNKKT